MYCAKEQGRNNFQFFSKEMNDRALNRLELENTLREAISKERFLLHYQPVVDLNSMRIMGMECLLRWKKRPDTVVSAKEFIPIAEETGLILPIGEWAPAYCLPAKQTMARYGFAACAGFGQCVWQSGETGRFCRYCHGHLG